jgi:hypothetical protein
MKKNMLIPLAGALVAAAGLAVVIFNQSTAEAPGPGLDWVNANVQEYRQTLAVAPEGEQKVLLEQKLSQMEYIQEQQQAGAESPAVKNPDPCAFLPKAELQSAAPRTAGITGELAAPLSPDDFTLSNAWQDQIGENWVQVFAGALTADPQQGTLWLDVVDTADFVQINAPQPGGALTITAAQGPLLTLSDAAGNTLYFDAAARSFLSDPAQVLPAVEPQPTFTPTPVLCP